LIETHDWIQRWPLSLNISPYFKNHDKMKILATRPSTASALGHDNRSGGDQGINFCITKARRHQHLTRMLAKRRR
jgi:hypothetical protein